MGNCASASGTVRDAFGIWLDEDCWVECTANAANVNLGKVRLIQDGATTFFWPGVGSYVYGMNDIYYYGMKRTMADVSGYKLTTGQLVKSEDGRQGMVRDVTETDAVIVFGGGGWDGSDGTYQQVDIDRIGLRVVASARGRSCNDACM